MHEADAGAESSDGHTEFAPRRLDFRWSTLLILLAAAVLSVVLLTTLVTPGERDIGLLEGGWDFHVYRAGGRYALHDLPLYAKPLDCCKPLLYTYTPFSALIFVPFVWLPDHADQYIWFAINVVLLIAVVMLCFRVLRYRITPYLAGLSALVAVACAFLEPVRTTLFYGQINVLLMLLVLWDASRPEGSRLKGIGIGLATGIKITPAYFVVYYLLLRQWRAAGVAVATLAVTIGLGWLVLADDSGQYWSGKFLDSSRISDWLFNPANQSVRGAIARLTKEMPATWLWVLADVCVAAISMWIAVRLYRRGEPLLAVTVAGLSATAASPFTWTHHWVWLVPMIVYLVHRAFGNAWWWVGVVPLLAVMGSWPVLLPNDRQQRIGLYLFPHTGVPWQILVNLHLTVYAALLIVAGVIACRLPRVARRGQLAGEADERPSPTAVPVGSTERADRSPAT